MPIREFIIVLLLVNACFYIRRQMQVKVSRLDHLQLVEVKLKGAAYLLINIICASLVFLI